MNTDTITKEAEIENWRDSWVIESVLLEAPDLFETHKTPKDPRTWVEYFDKMWNISVIFGVGSIIYFYISRTNSTSKF